MKKLFILFLAAGLLAACNNSNPFVKNSAAKENEKEDRKENEGKNDKADDRNDRYKKEDEGSDDTRSGWTKSDRNKWMGRCEDELSDNPKAKQICACVIEKAERKYPDVKDAEDAPDAEGERLIKECATGMGGDDEYTDDRYKDKRVGTEPDEKSDEGNSWSNLQRKQFTQGCAMAARQKQGFTAEQANTYCDCMVRKLEKKYTFQKAASMTAADFQTQEWVDAADDCRGRLY
jgi:hypothetical protein